MMWRLPTVTCALSLMCVAVSASAERLDPRLATLRKAWVEPIDDLADDKPVAACFGEHLSMQTPMRLVTTRDDAEIIFKVRANIPSATKRVFLGPTGGSPSIHADAILADGTKLWSDGAKLRRTIINKSFGRLESSDGTKGVECGLADELLVTLRDAMREARKSAR